MSWHMSPRYAHGILVSGNPVLTAVNWPYCECPILKSYIKDVDLPTHPWDTPPFLLIVFPTPPVQSVDAYVRMYVRTYVRTYARSVTWQPNEKRLTIFHEYGALSHARFARAGAPLKMLAREASLCRKRNVFVCALRVLPSLPLQNFSLSTISNFEDFEDFEHSDFWSSSPRQTAIFSFDELN